MAVKIGYESGYAEGRASRDAEVEKLASWKGGGIEVSLDAWEALQARVLESQQHREAMNKEPKNLVDERDAVDPRWYKMDFDFVKAKIDALKADRDSALAKLAALEPVNHRLLEALKEYIAAADNSMMPEDADDVAAMLRFGEADKQARAAIAAGAQAQPLSDEQIVDIAVKECVAEGGTNGYILPISFARAIEKAHKIGGSV